MSNSESTPNTAPLKKAPSLQNELAALDNFMRLKQSQAEYLLWLEASEKKEELDGYTYRQIR
jgi:hypothetical protein